MEVASSPADDWLRLNRAWWDERAPVHAASGFYDVPGFLAGKDSLRAFEPGEVGDVRGKRLLHLMCHIGLDTLSWARRGAVVTGLDFSRPALDTAVSLAGRAGIGSARFVAAEIGDAKFIREKGVVFFLLVSPVMNFECLECNYPYHFVTRCLDRECAGLEAFLNRAQCLATLRQASVSGGTARSALTSAASCISDSTAIAVPAELQSRMTSLPALTWR